MTERMKEVDRIVTGFVLYAAVFASGVTFGMLLYLLHH
jgi:hypothetical protein